MSGWLLTRLEIEGFRGINNDGNPLVLDFSLDAVNSISAQNGVGKSSIFDALTFAVRGSLPKLEELPAVEKGADYYLNRFHPKDIGTISLTISPESGGQPVRIEIECAADGKRTVSGPVGVDAEALLNSLDRDFVLLDNKALQTFIDDKALERGRSFSGLIGLERYSTLRQELQKLANTLAFNNHFETATLAKQLELARGQVVRFQDAAKIAFESLTKTPLVDQPDLAFAERCAHNALHQIAVLKPHCIEKSFGDIVIDDCLAAIRVAEGGDDQTRFAALIQRQEFWEALIGNCPDGADKATLTTLAADRDSALATTAGPLLHELYVLSRDVLASDTWIDKSICPTCGQKATHSILDEMHAKLANYRAVEIATVAISDEWARGNWPRMIALEAAAQADGDTLLFAEAETKLSSHSLTVDRVGELWAWGRTLISRVQNKLADIKAERLALELKLPPSLVAVTISVEAARQLQQSWRDLAVASAEVRTIVAKQTRITRVKHFLDGANIRFATAEAAASTRRLAAIEPLFQDIFNAIMHQPIKPILVKQVSGEGLSLALAEFWTLKDASAQALLSESYRNAFAMSVYLAAATLYSGDPKFMVLDDVTSSLDAGHQLHLMEVIRTRFARPRNTGGMQVILLSHDALLEKLFNKNSGQPDWAHQRIEGTARTAVWQLPNAVDRVSKRTIELLNNGRVDDASPFIRQYLELILLEIIGRVKIPVPLDLAFDDNKKQPQTMIDAINDAINLHNAAGTIVLDTSQLSNRQIHIATIIGNFLGHYATGSTHAFSAASLLGVMKAIDAFADCFKFEERPGSGTRLYYKNLSHRS